MQEKTGSAIDLTNQSRTVLGGTLGKIINEGFDQIPAGISEGGSSAVIGGVGFYQARIELMLANQQGV